MLKYLKLSNLEDEQKSNFKYSISKAFKILHKALLPFSSLLPTKI